MTLSDLYTSTEAREGGVGGVRQSKTLRDRERGGEGGGRQSHLIANKSQKALKNCCLSFTFQFYKETIFLFHPSQLSVVEKKNLHY